MHAPQWTTSLYGRRSSGKSCPCTLRNSSLPPTYCVSQRGILTRPMSSPIGWCEQASAMRTRSPGCRSSMASAPRTNSARSPLYRAKRMEKRGQRHVRRRVAGDLQEALRVGDDERRRALEPVERVAQFALLDDEAVGVVVEHVADGLTCGRISRPLGASRSIGTTSTTSSPGGTRSPRMAGALMKSSGAARISASRRSRMPFPAAGDGPRRTGSSATSARRPLSGPAPARSVLLSTTTTGVFRAAQFGQDALLERAPRRPPRRR